LQCFVYCRVSTEEQARDDHYSLSNQEQRARDYATAKGWRVARIEKDVASGKNADRRGYRELLSAIEQGELEESGPRPSKELPFLHQVENSLARWARCEIRKVYYPSESAVANPDDPAEIARLQQRQRAARKEWDGAIFKAPDGAKYVTIVQLAGKLGCPEHQLRRFDRELGVRRVSDVFGSNPPSLGRVKLKSNTRLYELSDEPGDVLVHRASQLVGRIGDPLADCKTPGITRAELCKKYSIAKSTILYWEKQGTLKPVREKGHVIYTKDEEELARRFARKPKRS